MLKAETAPTAIKLQRGEPQVKQDAMNREEVILNTDSLQFHKVFVYCLDRATIGDKPCPGNFYRPRVSINAQ